MAASPVPSAGHHRGSAEDEQARDVEDAIVRRVAEGAAEWFPQVRTGGAPRLRRLVVRPRAALYAVHLDESPVPHVLAKLRRDAPGDVTGRWAGTRPRLATGPLPTSETAALEFRGLSAISAMIEPDDPELTAVRPLALLPDADTILMDYVEADTLRDRMLGRSRLPLARPGWRRGPEDGQWQQVGAWLRRYQQTMPTTEVPARQARREEVVERITAYGEYLGARLGHRAVGDIARRGAELASAVLPERLPLAVVHGDFAPRNVFVFPDGRSAVFDPMPRSAAPRFDDLAAALVAMRLLGVQLHTRGAAFSRQDLARRERELIDGYFGDEQPALAELHCYQLLLTLDRWSALVEERPAGARGQLRRMSVRWASGFLRGEAGRLADLVERETAGPLPR
ncbi:phosphotransferase [Blastococcus goldschmidtiae]|uniref:Phosphotransferase n=1 Tax=Blastococcus goldschmidtiae TaxID=3075546 RepID=A0ABU2KB15_9ACTN|nr:phosphotransferase [Blastococcus sp. DSM 46792]MDT0277375.1 phosphotransferase [Blastococcus sp. DSM 46792]